MSRLLKTLATELEHALTVYQEACECGGCGPCTRQRRMRMLISQARKAAAGPEPIYRVYVDETTSYQPPPQDSLWKREVLYCGTDREEAFRLYHANAHRELFRGFGGRAVAVGVDKVTDSDEDFEDAEVEELEVTRG